MMYFLSIILIKILINFEFLQQLFFFKFYQYYLYITCFNYLPDRRVIQQKCKIVKQCIVFLPGYPHRSFLQKKITFSRVK